MIMELEKDRMPVILGGAETRKWLDPSITGPEKLAEILASSGDLELDWHPVSDYVNSAKKEGERCIVPVGPGGGSVRDR